MDALALLCNLHADGPATLQRLRRLGCESIDAVATLGELELGQELRQGASGAQRFKREAHNLQVRMQGGTALPEPDACDESLPVESALPRPAAMDHVLEAWRKMDDESPPAEPASYGKLEAQAKAKDLDALSSTSVEGLSTPLIKRLGELNIRSLGDLVDAPSLQLCQELPLALTRVRRLQLMARRVLKEKRVASHVETDRELDTSQTTPEPIIVLYPALQAFDPSPVQSAKEAAAQPEPEKELEIQEPQPVADVQERSRSTESCAPQGSLGEAKARDPELDRLDSAGPFA